MRCGICNDEHAKLYSNVPIMFTTDQLSGETVAPYISYKRIYLCELCVASMEEQFYYFSQLQNSLFISASGSRGMHLIGLDKLFDFKIDNRRDIFTLSENQKGFTDIWVSTGFDEEQ